MTAAKFIPDPFGREPGGRLYRTGDLARWRDEGVLEFLGRTDHQVKLRGFRIEPGEIEAALCRHPDVREAAVLARQDMPEDTRLVAYAAAREGKSPAISELRAFLRARLPEYMVPSAFVMLGALPLTPNGKLDRRALPPPDRAHPELGGTLPRTPGEETVAAIWREVLQLERVGVHDNFFDLGGHSLLLVRVHGRLRETFPRRDVSIVDLFRHSTVAALAAYLSPAPEPATPPADADADAERRDVGPERLARRRVIRVGPADTEETRA
jgi:hypothetical protein